MASWADLRSEDHGRARACIIIREQSITLSRYLHAMETTTRTLAGEPRTKRHNVRRDGRNYFIASACRDLVRVAIPRRQWRRMKIAQQGCTLAANVAVQEPRPRAGGDRSSAPI